MQWPLYIGLAKSLVHSGQSYVPSRFPLVFTSVDRQGPRLYIFTGRQYPTESGREFDNFPRPTKTNGCFQKLGVFPPKWMVKIMENPIEMDDLGVPLFLETPK